MAEKDISRRFFIMGTTAAAAGLATGVTTARRAVARTISPNEKLNIAGIGIGGRGHSDVRACASENIVALCDVDQKYAARTFNEYPKAKKHKDFRKMLDNQKDIDAVVVATPDHLHAIVSMTAIKMGKHVYCEKPLTHTIAEARALTEAARKANVATQMGIQGHSHEGIRLINEWIWAGTIGTVREVHIWTNRPIGYWPQGIDRPKETQPVPKTLDWDLWLGPAPYRPFNAIYCPFRWRGWWDFGTGALGDMACHLMDSPYWALHLDYPATVQAHTTPVNDETAPLASMIKYEFPKKGDRDAVNLYWYDGGMKAFRPDELEDGEPMGDKNGGILYVGDGGKILAKDENAQDPHLIPKSRMESFKQPPHTIPRSIGHHKEWIEACKGGKPGGANFDYSGPLTEIVLLGNLAVRTGKKLRWDGENMHCTNVPEADQYIKTKYREGWSL